MHIPASVPCTHSLIEYAGALIRSFVPWKPDPLGGSIAACGVTARACSHEVKADIEKSMASF